MGGEYELGLIVDGINRIADRLEAFIKVSDSGQQFPQPNPRFTDAQDARINQWVSSSVWFLYVLFSEQKMSDDQVDYILQLFETRLREANEGTHE